MPRPAAKANGRRVTSPNRIVIAPAVRAVTAATAPQPSPSRATSAPPGSMIGVRITTQAIVTIVTTAPRASALTVETREALLKNRTNRPRGAEEGVDVSGSLGRMRPQGWGGRGSRRVLNWMDAANRRVSARDHRVGTL